MAYLSGATTPDPRRQELQPVIGAVAEALLPSQPQRAAAARGQGQHDLAKFYDISGREQTAHMQEVSLLQHSTSRLACRAMLTCYQMPMQAVQRIERNLTPESRKELYLYVPATRHNSFLHCTLPECTKQQV